MNKPLKITIIIALIVIFFAGIVVIKEISKGKSKVPDNEPGCVGNTAGNLYNKGLFTQDGNTVYFANPYDNYNIYVMNDDQTDCHKFVSGKASFLNIAGDYLYYYTEDSGEQVGLGYVCNGRGFFRTSASGKKTFSLPKGTSDSMLLVENTLYYTEFSADDLKKDSAKVVVKSCGTDGSPKDDIIDMHIVLGSYNQGKIYFGGVTGDHHLYAYDIASKAVTLINGNINVYLPTAINDYIFYLDLDNNYALNRLSLSSGEIITLTDERIDTFNLYSTVIFYQTVDKDGNYALKKINTDGTGEQIVANGVFENINCTSTYTYFNEFGAETPVYYVPTFGSGEKSIFNSAESAAVEEMSK